MLNLRGSRQALRLSILASTVIGLLVAFGVNSNGLLEPVDRAEAVESTTTWMYPASGGIQAGAGPAEATIPFVPAACLNCYITRIVPELVYQNDPDPANHPDGTTANFNNNSAHNIWLHHMVLVNSCDITKRPFASGNERSVWQAPAGYGYFQNCTGGWHLNYHIHNNSSVTRGVAIKLVITYRTGETLIPLTPVNLDTSSTGDGEFTIPEGYSDTHTGSGAMGISPDWTSNIQGKIVAMGGHVHNYGISVSAYNNRLGDYICTSVAGYGTGSRYLPTGGQGTPGHPASGIAATLNQSYHEVGGSPDDRYHIQSMTPCAPSAAQSILCIGDVIRLHSQYNNTSSFPVFDAMGIMSPLVDTSLPDSNSNGTIDACEDNDADGHRNSADNCPDWANASQTMPPWVVPADDADCDGFPATIGTGMPLGRGPELAIGTTATIKCAALAGANNETGDDRWPVDFNDSQSANTQDILFYVGKINYTSPNPLYLPRYDLDANLTVNTLDILKFVPFLNKTCS